VLRCLVCLSIFLAAFSAPDEHRIDADDLLRFSVTEIRARAGSEITIHLHNKGKLATMRHNLVILKPDTDLSRFGNAAMNAEDTDYIPADMREWVIANTALASPGQTVSTTVEVPTVKGRYPYLCSFSGHYSVSKGVMIVE